MKDDLSIATLGRKAAFLDRDGVINVDKGYVSRWEDFEFLPGAIKGMKLLQDAGFLLVVITNQSGIARGYFSEDDYKLLTRKYSSYLSAKGVLITSVYHCPHHPGYSESPNCTFTCNCRKPKPGLIHKASLRHGLSLYDSVMIGDKVSDMQAANAAGIPRRFLLPRVKSEGLLAHNSEHQNWLTAGSLLECARMIQVLDKRRKAD